MIRLKMVRRRKVRAMASVLLVFFFCFGKTNGRTVRIDMFQRVNVK